MEPLATETTQTAPQSINDLRPKMRLNGIVKDIQLYGAIVDIGLERDGLVHISQLAPRRVNRVADVVNCGDTVTVWVTTIDPTKGYIGLTMVEPPTVEWSEIEEGNVYTGTVTRLEPYGAFVDIGAERPGLLHVRDMAAGYVRHPSEIVQVGSKVEVRVIKLDRRKKRIDLAIADLADEPEEETEEKPLTAMEAALQRAQSKPQQRKQRQEKREKRLPSDLAEREKILARTLEQHAKR